MRFAVLAFAAGIWLLQRQPSLPDVGGLSALLLCLLAFSWYFPRGRWQRVALWSAAFLAGFLWADGMARWRMADALPAPWEGREITLVGYVAEMPQRADYGTRFRFDVERAATTDAVLPRHLLLTWYAPQAGWKNAAPPPELHAGERWRLTVQLKRPHGNANPGGFDYEAWLLERGIRATGFVLADPDNRRETAAGYHPLYAMERAREAVSSRMAQALGNRPYAGVLRALAVGDQNAIPAAQWKVFARTGVTHLMSISGLHITMLAGLAAWLVRRVWPRIPGLALRLPARRAAALTGVMTALGYAWLSGFSVPAQRTFYMLAVVALALWLGRAMSASRVLAAALLVVLLFDPWAVLAPGFWLSFGAVALIFFVSSWRLGRGHWLGEWGRVQWAVTLGLAPLLLALFQQVSLVSPVANALAIPLVSAVVTPLTLAGALLPWDGPLLLAHQAMVVCMAVLEPMAELPAAVWVEHAPPFWALMLALAATGWMLLPRGFPARWVGVAGFMPLFLPVPDVPGLGEMRVAVLDVGQGLAAVVRTRHHTLLFDGGPRYGPEADGGGRVVVPYLVAAGVRQLDGVVVSHDDSDHYGGVASVVEMFPSGWMLSSLPPGHDLHGKVPVSARCASGERWVWDEVVFEMLNPALDSYADDGLTNNERSCVLRVTSRSGSLLLTGDIPAGVEARLAETHGLPPADVLVVPHHGSRSSSSDALIGSVRPRLAVFSAGYRNRFGHPAGEVLSRYRSAGANALRTDRDGAVELVFGPIAWHAITWRTAEARYWRAETDLTSERLQKPGGEEE